MNYKEMEIGKIYHISYSPNAQVLCRFKEKEITQLNFFDHLYYWNGFESFHIGGYSATSGIEELRHATQAEKMALIRFEIEHNCI